MDRFKGKVVLVTGSTRGIGKAIAEAFLREGASVVLNYRKRDGEAKKAVEELSSISSNFIIIKADVSKTEEVDRLFKEIDAAYGRLDILVNNAGIGIAYPFIEHSVELWDRMIEINLRSAFLCSKKAAEYMIRNRWGRIINITSVAGIIGAAGLVSYSAAKAGIVGLTKTLAIELAKYNITVNAIACGWVRTDLSMSFFRLFSEAGKEEEFAKEWAKKHILIGRLLEPDEIAHAALFLSDEKSSGITGQVLIVDGGQTLGIYEAMS